MKKTKEKVRAGDPDYINEDGRLAEGSGAESSGADP